MKKRVLLSKKEEKLVNKQLSKLIKGVDTFRVRDKRIDDNPEKHDSDYYVVQTFYCGRFIMSHYDIPFVLTA